MFVIRNSKEQSPCCRPALRAKESIAPEARSAGHCLQRQPTGPCRRGAVRLEKPDGEQRVRVLVRLCFESAPAVPFAAAVPPARAAATSVAATAVLSGTASERSIQPAPTPKPARPMPAATMRALRAVRGAAVVAKVFRADTKTSFDNAWVLAPCPKAFDAGSAIAAARRLRNRSSPNA